MSTAANIIDRAHRILGQIGAGETCTASEYSDGLTALNALLDSWRNDQLFCYAMQEEALTLSSGTSSYTVGPSGTLVTTRPIEILDAYIRDNSIDYPVQIITNEEYNTIPAKSTQSNWPDRMNYTPTMPNGTVYVYPVPNATRTLYLMTRVVLTSFSATTDTVSLPPGWERAMAYNLAIEMAPEYQTEPTPTTVVLAKASKAQIKQANSNPIFGNNELVYMKKPDFHIMTGQ